MSNNSDSVINSILQSSEVLSDNNLSSSSASSSDYNSNSNFGILGYIQSITFSTWIIIILILAFLGFNIFVYLAKGTQDISDIFGPIFKKIFGGAIAVTSQTVDVSAEGAKAVVNTTANVLDTSLTKLQNLTPTSYPDNTTNNATNKAINTKQYSRENQDYQADSSTSNIQSGGKAGWCYIGTDRGFRSCAEVGINDTCMSGDIFPTQEVCINPSLRA